MTASLFMICSLMAAQTPIVPSMIPQQDSSISVPSLPAPSIAAPTSSSTTPATSPQQSANLDPNKPIMLANRTAIIDIQYEQATRKLVQRALLYVSSDQGQTWNLEATALPEQETFRFTVPNDGLYFCSIQLIYNNGKREPADVTRAPPETKLLLDGTPPQIQISSAKRVGEEVAIDWSIQEKFLDEANTVVRYRSLDTANSSWTVVPVSVANKRSLTFKPNVNGSVAVEVLVQDYVGNKNSAKADIAVVTAAQYSAATGQPQYQPQPPVQPIQPPVQPVQPVQPISTTPDGAIIPGSIQTGGQLAMPRAVGNDSQQTQQQYDSQKLPQPSSPYVGMPGSTMIPSSRVPTNAPTTSLETLPINTTSTDIKSIPVPIKPINMTRFDLAYSITAGPAGVGGIDLWVTRNDGKSWQKWSRHDGKESPLKVVLDTHFNPNVEGMYGFRLVPESGSRLSDLAPTAGTPPEFRVVVDVSAPQIQVFEPMAHNDRPDVVVVRWRATDNNFGKEPVSIEWAESQTGPWRSISGNDSLPLIANSNSQVPIRMANTGEYSWRLPGELTSPKVYLKFTAWDLAGNKTEAMTRDPILVDLTRPRAKIQGIINISDGR